MKSLAAMGLALWMASTAAAQPPSAASGPAPLAAGDATRGKTLFIAHQCFACHGYNGETGTPLLRDDGTFATRLLTVRGFIAFIRAPRPTEPPPAGSSTTMPSYGAASLPDQQAADLFAYIKSFKPTQPPLADIPLLSRMLKEVPKPKQ
jgi:mono/diheme cytochrome c family protein